ncbi:site-specific DNA-methyltransferase [Bradyrhizobium sp.]
MNPKLKIETWPIDKVINYARNARLHSEEQVKAIAASITEFGFINPCLVDPDGVLIAGHGRVLASKQLGHKTVPVIRLGHLAEIQIRALRIADNALPERASWQTELLRLELTDLQLAGYDLPLLGFEDAHLVSFMAGAPSGNDPEATPEPPVNPVTRMGDIWLLGKHRILCGDSTKAEDVDRVLDGKKPRLMVTDAPYGVDYDANWRNEADRANGKPYGASAIGTVENDERVDWSEAWSLFPGNVAYCWHADRHASTVQSSLESVGFEIVCQVIWAKSRLIISRGDYHWQHEPCWYAVRKGKKHNWSGDRSQTTLWTIEHAKSETGHSTQKPIECMRRPIQNNSKPGDYVYEPFAGSGTTIIAAEMMNRYCLAIELAPNYVDVCVRRFQDFTKSEATLSGDGRTFAEIAKARKSNGRKKDATRDSRKSVQSGNARGNGSKHPVRKGGDAGQPAKRRKPAGESPALAGDS